MPARRTARRSQEERSALTRERILDAAIRCLVEHGFSGTTTTAVAKEAGVSRGAQLHHFPTRHQLLAAAVAHLYAGLTERFQKGFAQLPPEADRVRAALGLLWEIFLDPALTAALELQVAARTDGALLAALLPVVEQHSVNVHRLARESFPEVDDLAPMLDLILDAYSGLRGRALLVPNDPAIPRTLALLEGLARRALSGETIDA